MSLRSMLLRTVTFSLVAIAFTATASAQRFQVDADMTGYVGYGLGYPPAGPTVRAGILLSDRLAIEAGIGFFADLETKDDSYYARVFRLPVDVAWYFADAKPQALVPSIRAVATYQQGLQHQSYWDGETRRSFNIKNHILGASVLLGVTYFVSERFGISAQGGPHYSKLFLGRGPAGFGSLNQSSHFISGDYRIGLVFRS